MPEVTPAMIRMAWKTGMLAYRLRNGQKKARQKGIEVFSKFLKFYLECTRRFGKSSYGLSWLSEDAIQHPGGVSAFFAPVKEGLKDYIQPIITETFKDCPEDLRPTLDSSLTLVFPNGSKIIFRGSNNQQHRTKRGNAFRRVYIDEGRDVDDLDNLVDSVVIPSLFSGEGRLMIGSTPADTEDHPLHAIKQAAEREGWYFHFTIMDAHRYDPLDFPLARIELWKKETKDTVAWEREYMARWVKDPTKIIIPEWNDAFAVRVPRDEYFPWYQKYDALDSGVTDKTAGILGYYDFRNARLVIEGEFVLQGEEVRTDRIAHQLKALEVSLDYQAEHDRTHDSYKRLAPNQKIYRRVADNNNLILVQDLNALYGLDFYPTTKDELAAMINMARLWIQAGRVLVSPDCPELLGCLNNAIWDKNRKELAKSKVYGHFDALMALVYLIRNVDTATNPIPLFFGKSWSTHANVPIRGQHVQQPAEKLVAAFSKPTQRQEARSDFAKGRIGNGIG